MNDSTFFDQQHLNELKKQEKALNDLLKNKANNQKPKKESVNNILAYSKAVSVRHTDQLGYIEQLLN